MSFRYAENVLTGDDVMVLENNEMTTAKVIKVASFKIQGILLILKYFGGFILH